MEDDKKAAVATPTGKVKMVTAGMFKMGGKVYPAGSEVLVSTDDILANPANFSKVKKVVEPKAGEPETKK